MSKLIILNFLLILLIVGCRSSEYLIANIPNSMPPLLQVDTGLSSELKEEVIVFEKYVQTRMGTASATKIYANGDFYKIYLGTNESITDSTISWKKLGVISQNGLKRIQKIANNDVVDYLNDGPHKIGDGAIENVNWYFYNDQPKYVRTQLMQWRWSWNESPNFVRKIDRVVARNLTFE